MAGDRREGDTEAFDVPHFPIYGLKEIRKFNRRVKLKCDKQVWLLALSPTAVAVIDGFIR